MPSLSLQRFDIFSRPLVRVEGKPGLAQQVSLQSHPPNSVPRFLEDFIVDTGATSCVVEEDLIASWNLMKNMPVIAMVGARPKAVGYEYPLTLRLLEPGQKDSWYHAAVAVAAVPKGHFDGYCRGLIGMNVLSQGGIRYDGSGMGVFELTWP
jgi:hypothetical protein